MSNISLYFDDKTEQALRDKAKKNNSSFSAYVKQLIDRGMGNEQPPSDDTLNNKALARELLISTRESINLQISTLLKLYENDSHAMNNIVEKSRQAACHYVADYDAHQKGQ